MHGTNVKIKKKELSGFLCVLLPGCQYCLSFNLWLSSGETFHYECTQSKVVQAISDNIGFMSMLLYTFNATCFSLSINSHHQAKLEYQRELIM
jgi:hypothetical protein